MIQYGLRYPDGLEVAYPDREAAAAAQERMRRWPCTKYVKLIQREISLGSWQIAE